MPEMEQVYQELEDMRSAMEALTAECQAKTALSLSMRRANDEQLARLQQARAQIEKQAKEIDAKDGEISVAKQMYDDLRSKLCEKESALKHMSSANENLRASFAEKLAGVEGENRRIVSALDEASAKEEEKDAVVLSCKQEIEKLKGLLSASQKKCIDAERKAQASREVTRRDETIAKLERDKGEFEEQLKWKSERFRHLEEAHDKLQEKFRACKKEWEMERANLVYEVSSLQGSLDSQTRVAADLKSRLCLCTEALSREEGRRKLLENQMSESKALYENVVSEYEDARLNIRSLAERRDDEIASLRNLLATKATLAKELEFKTAHLKQENEELRSSLKELREAQIDGVGAAASFKTLQQKFRALEQAHRGCSDKLKARDAEWRTERENLSNELDDCLSKLNEKDKQIQYMQAELEVGYSSLIQQKLENEERSVILMILKSKFLESCEIIEDLKHESEQYIKKTEERIQLLMEQLEKKNGDLAHCQAEIKHEREKVSSLLSKLDHSESMEQEYFLMQKDIKSYKEMVEGSSKKLEQLEQQAVQREKDLLEDVKKALVDLDRANFALAEKRNKLSEVEFELVQSKLVVERMQKTINGLEAELNKVCDDNLLIRRELEDSVREKVKAEKGLNERSESFLQTLNQKEKKIEDLQRHIVLLEEDILEFETKLGLREKEKVTFLRFVEDMDMKLRYTQTGVDSLEQNYVLSEIEMVIKLEENKMEFQQVIEDKEKVIADMQHEILTSKQDFARYVEVAASSKHRDGQLELCALTEVSQKKLAHHILDEQEIYYRNILVAELEEEIHALQMKADSGEKLSFVLKSCIQELEAKLATVLLERGKEKVHFENELNKLLSSKMTLEVQVDTLQSEKKALEAQASELEEVIDALPLKAEPGEKLPSILRNYIQELEAKFATVLLEKGKEQVHFENEIRSLISCKMTLEVQSQKQQSEKRALEVQVAELEEEVHVLQLKAESGENLSSFLRNYIQELEAKLATVLLEKGQEQIHLENELKSSLSSKMTLEGQIEELKSEKMALEVQATELISEKRALYESILHLSSDREELVNQMMVFDDLIENISEKGEEVKRNWDRVLQIGTDDNTDVEVLFNSRKEGMNLISPSKNKARHVAGRSPLKEHNC